MMTADSTDSKALAQEPMTAIISDAIRERYCIEIRNGLEVVVFNGPWAENVRNRSAGKYDPDWRPGIPVEITDSWTGRKYIVYPSAPPESYPPGYFGDSLSARYPHFSVSEKVDLLKFWIAQRREVAKKLSGIDLASAEELIGRWEKELQELLLVP